MAVKTTSGSALSGEPIRPLMTNLLFAIKSRCTRDSHTKFIQRRYTKTARSANKMLTVSGHTLQSVKLGSKFMFRNSSVVDEIKMRWQAVPGVRTGRPEATHARQTSFWYEVRRRANSHRLARHDKTVLSVSCPLRRRELDSRQLKTVAGRKYEV